MYIIKDNLGYHRGLICDLHSFDTVEEAITYAESDGVHMDPEDFPEEYPFSVVNKDTGEVAHQWHLPLIHQGPY